MPRAPSCNVFGSEISLFRLIQRLGGSPSLNPNGIQLLMRVVFISVFVLFSCSTERTATRRLVPHPAAIVAKVISFGGGPVALFPESYQTGSLVRGRPRFTPESSLVAQIYPEMQLKYCDFELHRRRSYLDSLVMDTLDHYVHYSRDPVGDDSRRLTPAERNLKYTEILHTVDCSRFDNWAKQIVGFVDFEGRRKLYISLIDLNASGHSYDSEPFGSRFISGLGPFFEAHTQLVVFDLDSLDFRENWEW